MAAAQSPLAAVFQNPGRDFSPTPFWWWSGERLEPQRLRWQMQQLAQGGVFNLVILNLAPTGPLYGKDADDPPFFSEEWWAIFQGVCRDAKALGMRLYFYDQIGFSGANFQGRLASRDPRCRGRQLICQRYELGEGETASLPESCEPLAAFFWPRNAEQPQRLQVHDRAATAPAAGRLWLIGSVVQGFDYFNAHACRALLEAIHGQFEQRVGAYLGNVIAGSFQDELPHLPTWSSDFAQCFQDKYGYDLRDHLWMLWQGDHAQAFHTRIDYHALRAELAQEAFFKPFFEWHQRHGMICGFDQQGPARAGDLHGGVHIYADYLRTHRWYAAPGADLHGEAHVHRSLADRFERPRVWMEGFHSTGWGGALEETFDWLLPWLRGGANLYNPHAVYYSTRGGWWEWAPPSTCFRQPYWRHYRLFADAVARCCHALTLGWHDCDIAVYYPTLTAQAGTTLDGPLPMVKAAQEAIRRLTGRAYWSAPEPGLLDELGEDYNFIDDMILDDACVEDGVLRVGRQHYRVVIVPSSAVMAAATLRLLLAFAQAGGLLIIHGRLPRYVLHDESGLTRSALEAACAAGRVHHVPDDDDRLRALLQRRPSLIVSPVPVHHRRVGDWHLALVPAVTLRATQDPRPDGPQRHWLDIDYDFDTARYASRITLLIRQADIHVEAWSPITATPRVVETRRVAQGTQLTLHFDDGPILWLAWRSNQNAERTQASKQTLPAPASQQSGPALLTLDSDWRCELLPAIDNRFGDVRLPASDTIPVEGWFARCVADDADAPEQVAWSNEKLVHFTFGPFGWRRTVRAEEPMDIADAAASPAGAWQPVVYSLSRGIEREGRNLGASGHVAEDFLDLGAVEAGQAADFRTWIPSDQQRDVLLVVGGPGVKDAAWNGQPLPRGAGGYRQLWPVTLQQGLNRLDFRITPAQPGPVRALWTLMARQLDRPWPQWIAWPGESRPGGRCRFRLDIHLDQQATGGAIQVLSLGPTVLSIDGREIGWHGGYEPYGVYVQPSRYACPPLAAGRHSIELTLTDCGQPPRLLLDGELILADGSKWFILSDSRWAVEREGAAPQAVALPTVMEYDPGFGLLERRPHPLVRTAWLERWSEPSPVLDVVPQALPWGLHRYWLRWRTPPGAVSMSVPAVGEAKLWVDGVPVALQESMAVLPRNDGLPREVVLRVDATPGHHAGAVLDGPVTYRVEPGRIELGDWTQQGLEAWSGGVRHERDLTLPDIPPGRLVLDLGRVRGTAEVHLNGVKIGQRFCAPWRFDLTGRLKPGSNTLRIDVFNTLAPWLHAASPTRFVYRGQTVSGLLGPVRLWHEPPLTPDASRQIQHASDAV